VCSSRLTEDGWVVITTPGVGCEVGQLFSVLGSSATFGISHADWAVRLLRPQAPTNGKAWHVGVDDREASLALAVKFGIVHESLVEEPGGPLHECANGSQPAPAPPRVKAWADRSRS
jgi:hypothetical protein